MKRITLLIFSITMIMAGYAQQTLDYKTINIINHNANLLNLYQAESLDSIITDVDILGNSFVAEYAKFDYKDFGKVSHSEIYLDDQLNDFIDFSALNKELNLMTYNDYFYDEQYLLKEVITKEIDQVTNNLINVSKNELFYDNNMVSYTDNYKWENASSQWILNGKSVIIYDGELLIETQDYSFINGEMKLISLTNFTFDENEDVVLIISKEWDDDTQMMVEEDKVELQYLSQHVIQQLIQYDYNGNTWESVNKITFEYGNNNDVSEFVLYSKNDNGIFEKNVKGEMFYDNSSNFEDVIIPLEVAQIYQFVHQKINYIDVYYYTFVGFQKVGKVNFYYNFMEVTIDNISEQQMIETSIIYPNPANDNITIKLNNDKFKGIIDIYDIMGKKILSCEVHAQSVISVSQLNPGAYFFHLHNEHSKYQGNFIKK